MYTPLECHLFSIVFGLKSKQQINYNFGKNLGTKAIDRMDTSRLKLDASVSYP